jgi:WG containing repeat
MKKIISILTLLTIAFGGFAQNYLVLNKDLYQEGGEEFVLITPEGKVIKSFKDVGIKTSISEGLIAAIDKKTKKLGYLSAETGEWAIKPQYENTYSVYPFKEGMAIICIDAAGGFNKTIIDKTGKMLLPFSAWDIENFSEGLAIVRQTIDGIESSGAIDKTGKLVIPFSKGHIESFKEGLAVKMDEKNKAGFIDKTGNWVIKPQWETVSAFSEGLAWVSLRSEEPTYGYIDKTGKLVIKYEYPTAEPFSEGLAMGTMLL